MQAPPGFVEASENANAVANDVDQLLRNRPIMFFIAGIGKAAKIAQDVGDATYENYNCYSRKTLSDSGRMVYMFALEEDGWVPPEVLENRRRKKESSRRGILKRRR